MRGSDEIHPLPRGALAGEPAAPSIELASVEQAHVAGTWSLQHLSGEPASPAESSAPENTTRPHTLPYFSTTRRPRRRTGADAAPQSLEAMSPPEPVESRSAPVQEAAQRPQRRDEELLHEVVTDEELLHEVVTDEELLHEVVTNEESPEPSPARVTEVLREPPLAKGTPLHSPPPVPREPPPEPAMRPEPPPAVTSPAHFELESSPSVTRPTQKLRGRPYGQLVYKIGVGVAAALILGAAAWWVGTRHALPTSSAGQELAQAAEAARAPSPAHDDDTGDRLHDEPAGADLPAAEAAPAALAGRGEPSPGAGRARDPQPSWRQEQTALPAVPEDSMAGMLRRGRLAARRGAWEEAQALFQAALQKDPDSHHAMAGLVRIYLGAGRPLAALPLTARMVEKRPQRISYWLMHGDVLVAVGRREEALRAWWRVLDRAPNHAQARARMERFGQHGR